MQKMLLILSELSDEDLDWMATVGHKKSVAPGTTLISEGERVETLYILLDGMVVVSVSALEGRQIARLSTGEVIGEMSFIESRSPSATVQTLESSTVLAIPRSLLVEKLQQDLGFGCRFYRALAILLSQRLRGTVKQLGPDFHAHPDSSEALELPSRDGVAIAQGRFERLLSHLQA